MINDNIVITIIDCKYGQCKVAIDADKDVKIYREEIYYQVKLANLVGKNTNISSVDSVSGMIKNENLKLNDNMIQTDEAADISTDKPKKPKFIIKKQNNN